MSARAVALGTVAFLVGCGVAPSSPSPSANPPRVSPNAESSARPETSVALPPSPSASVSAAPTRTSERPAPAPHPPIAATPPCVAGRPLDLNCASFGFEGGAARCTARGEIDVSACTSPRVSNPDITNRGASNCGNGRIDFVEQANCPPCLPGKHCPCGMARRQTEECDGASLDHKSCTGFGYLGGTLACSRSCTFDTSGCSKVAAGHPWPALRLPGLAGYGPGTTFPATLAASGGAVGVAWVVDTGPSNEREWPPPRRGVRARGLRFARPLS